VEVRGQGLFTIISESACGDSKITKKIWITGPMVKIKIKYLLNTDQE
jgi:hypothetical protein